MEHLPANPAKATLVDLLDRVLEKGLIIDADIIVSVTGIPLLGVKLRAALAGMAQMHKFGMMTQWDAELRATERARRARALVAAERGPEGKEGPLHA